MLVIETHLDTQIPFLSEAELSEQGRYRSTQSGSGVSVEKTVNVPSPSPIQKNVMMRFVPMRIAYVLVK